MVQRIQPFLCKYTLCDKLVLFGEGIKHRLLPDTNLTLELKKNGQHKHSQGAQRIAIRKKKKEREREREK